MATTDDVSSNRAIVTILGSDRSGIVAAVTGVLAGHEVNILDISQTILHGIFTMTMLIDLGQADDGFSTIQAELTELADKLGVQVTVQREEVFKFMYRL